MALAKPKTPSEPASVSQLVPGGRPVQGTTPAEVQEPTSAVAAALAALATAQPDRLIVHLASSERRADEIGRALSCFAPGLSAVLPPWDCLPYDRASPSREAMGRRMATLALITGRQPSVRVLLVSPEALLQRLPPADVATTSFHLAAGTALDRNALAQFAQRTGYVSDDRIDEPGEIAFHGDVVDLYPASSATPLRLRLDDKGILTEIQLYDPLTQRSTGALDSVVVGPASEWIDAAKEQQETKPGSPFVWERRPAGAEHGLSRHYGSLPSLFDLAPGAVATRDAKFESRLGRVQRQIEDAYQAQRDLNTSQGASALPSSALYLTGDALRAALAGWPGAALDLSGMEPAPRFFETRSPQRAFRSFVERAQGAGQAVLVVGSPDELHRIAPTLKRLGKAERVDHTWLQDNSAHPSFATMIGDLEQGFTDLRQGRHVIAAGDVLGARLAAKTAPAGAPVDTADLRPGDLVIHEDHGVGVVRALRTVAVEGGAEDTLELEYHGGTRLLVPIDELDRVWRYGGDEDAVALDRLKGDAWPKRRAAISRHVDRAARHLVRLAKERAARRCEPLAPPRDRYEAFAARFAFSETTDQASAIQAVQEDLAAGRPMDRLICGDVGFGKTEVALRAAAFAALSGRQVALVAPTTVLARQHAETFRRRFAGMGIEIAQLSRLVSAKEAKRVRAGLADGSIRVVIGTHAIASRQVTFRDLALMIIDEEQKFGAAAKAALRKKAEQVHLLTMTATPIPRTLQGAMVGLQDISVLATAPARRRPIRTFLAPFDPATLATALRRERTRQGQSFLVVPRIEDIEPLRARLATIVPDLTVRVAHGDLPASEVDDVMVGFADGEGDVLLATAIIESGLDVPSANTMIIWRPERFGLAQLHQLRGRVGRGRAQGVVFLLTDSDTPLEGSALARLETLQAFDRLGAGLELSARDLELRGGGDLIGEDQAGHIKLVGTDLYHRLLRRALRVARGEPVIDETTLSLNVGVKGLLPESYVADPILRLNLYGRTARLESLEEVDEFREELEDRFGPLPDMAANLLALARLRCLARLAGVREIVTGPKATVVKLSPARLAASFRTLQAAYPTCQLREDRLILPATDHEGGMTVSDVEQVLRALGEPLRSATLPRRATSARTRASSPRKTRSGKTARSRAAE